MAGNVSEWVMDVYRPLIDPNTTDLNPFRGNVFETWQRDEDRFIVGKDTLGNIIKREVTTEGNLNRRNYSSSDNINYLDGDYDSKVNAPAAAWITDEIQENTTNNVYELNKSSLISRQNTYL